MIWRYVMLAAMVSFLAACSESSSRVEVPFTVTYSGSPVACDGSATTTLTDLRFYVHNVRVFDANGQAKSVQLDEGEWQQPDLAFLDLEDGTGGCANGTSETNAVVQGTVIGKNFRGLEFTLGVPFSRNHGDPLKAQRPLGDAAMHWHWRGGYKFMRAGLRNNVDSFWIHLGSTGCQGTIRNITGCNAPNRVTVRLDNFVPGDAVLIDLAQLVSAGALDDETSSDCSSGPAEEGCLDAFAALGLGHAGEQRLFSSRRLP
jgi:uncharacterized repeat protein (TIGR04052 family)